MSLFGFKVIPMLPTRPTLYYVGQDRDYLVRLAAVSEFCFADQGWPVQLTTVDEFDSETMSVSAWKEALADMIEKTRSGQLIDMDQLENLREHASILEKVEQLEPFRELRGRKLAEEALKFALPSEEEEELERLLNENS